MKKYTIEELNALKKEELTALVMQFQNQLALFEERIAEMEARLFGRKTEKLDTLAKEEEPEEQAFNEAELESDDDAEEPEEETVVRKRSKRPKGKLDQDLKDIPVRVEPHELSDEELIKIFGENGWKRLPDEVYRKLEYHPATREVVEHHVAVYAAKDENAEKRVVKAPRPAELLPHSIVTPSLLAAILNGKYTNALPLYRISQEFDRSGLNLSVPTMSNWVIRCSERYLSLIWERYAVELRMLPVVQADETTCEVNKDDRPANAKSYMFVYRSGEFNTQRRIIIYDYQKTRNAEHLERFLTGFSGILVSDAYSGYHTLDRKREDIHVAHCWAHARRDFADALKAYKKTGPSKKRVKQTIAYQALERIGTFYVLEDGWKDLSPEERLIRRQEHLKPLVEAYFAWIKSIDPESVGSQKTRDGLKYSVNQEIYLKVFLEDGNVPIDNSASERAIRPFVVGRSNWRVMDTIHGAQASAIVYSIVETAKANNLKPYEYLCLLLTEIPKHMDETSAAFLDNLLPWSSSIPDICRKPELQNSTSGT